MKKVLVLFLSAVLVMSLLFTACSGGGGGTTEATTQAAAQTTAATQTTAAAAETTEAAETTAAAQETTAAAQTTQAAAEPADIVPIKITFPGNMPEEWDRKKALLDAKMQADGLNVELDTIYIPFAELLQKNQLMMNASEDIDLLFDAPFASIVQNIAAGFYEPLEDLLAQYGQNIVRTRGDFMMEANKFNGRIYGIPMGVAHKAPTRIVFREDIRQELGIDMPTNWEELFDMARKFKAHDPDKPVFGASADNYRWVRIKSHGINILGLNDYIPDFYLDPGGTTVKHPVIEKENGVLWPLYQEARMMFLEGLIDPDALSVNEQGDSFMSGKVSMLLTVEAGISQTQKDELAANIPGALMQEVSFPELVTYTDGKAYTHFKQWNYQVVPIQSKKKELAISLLDWTNASQENYDLCAYGVEGEDWERVGEQQYRPLKEWGVYGFAWIWNPLYHRISVDLTQQMYEMQLDFMNQDYFEPSAWMGFTFDSEPVKNEWAQHQAIFAKYIGIEFGMVDPMETLLKWEEEDIRNINVILPEIQRQLDAHLASAG